jgi:hypothetical protein
MGFLTLKDRTDAKKFKSGRGLHGLPAAVVVRLGTAGVKSPDAF